MKIASLTVGEATAIVDFSLAPAPGEILHEGATPAHEIFAVL
ncbi:MAG TPA: hypothetical protein VJX73_01505 [Terracidiphilus sp.]|nr:hypothetical protein [Terracidiphilus sp.]